MHPGCIYDIKETWTCDEEHEAYVYIYVSIAISYLNIHKIDI